MFLCLGYWRTMAFQVGPSNFKPSNRGVWIGEQVREGLAAVVIQPGCGAGEAALPFRPVALPRRLLAVRCRGEFALVHPAACPKFTWPSVTSKLTRGVVSCKQMLA
jgi:hypothetical protein